MDYRELLSPENLQSVKGLEFLAKTILYGQHSGLHQSRRVGQGMEFSQYRSYEPGDDLRLLDWKMLARSSRYYIKQAEVDTSVIIKFIVDASGSMQHEDEGISKIDYCKLICAILGFLAKQQGDAIGLFSLNDLELKTLYPNSKIKQFNFFLHHLVELKTKGIWPENHSNLRALHDNRHRELIVFVSDMYESNNELTAFLKSIKTPRNEVLLVHLLANNELELSYGKNATLLDLETNTKVKISDTELVGITYQERINDFIEQTKLNMLQSGIEYHQFAINNPVSDMISTFLRRRASLL